MVSGVGLIVLGVLFVALGTSNMRGNISSVHWYHRQRVAKEDIIPFGKKVGLGTIVTGASVILFSGFALAAERSGKETFAVIGAVIMMIGIAIGLALSLYAMKKYNKGIF